MSSGQDRQGSSYFSGIPIKAFVGKLAVSRKTLRALAADSPQSATAGEGVDRRYEERLIGELLVKWPTMPATVTAERMPSSTH